MNDFVFDDILNKRIRFFGSVCASISHELNNVNSIANELTGLLEDTLEGCEAIQSEELTQINNIIGRIQKQFKRSEKIIKNFNKFSHSCDTVITTFSLTNIVQNFTEICVRNAGLKNIALEFSDTSEDIIVTNNQFELLRLYYLCFLLITENALQESKILCNTEIINNNNCIIFKFSGNDRQIGSGQLELLNTKFKDHGFYVKYNYEQNSSEIIITIENKN